MYRGFFFPVEASQDSGKELAATKPVVPEAKVAADAERNLARSIVRWHLPAFAEAFKKEKALAANWFFMDASNPMQKLK